MLRADLSCSELMLELDVNWGTPQSELPDEYRPMQLIVRGVSRLQVDAARFNGVQRIDAEQGTPPGFAPLPKDPNEFEFWISLLESNAFVRAVAATCVLRAN